MPDKRTNPRLRCCSISVGTFACLSLLPVLAYGFSVDINPAPSSPRSVGVVVQLNATVQDADPATTLYRFESRPVGGQWRVLRDFSPHSDFPWSTLDEDIYQVRVIAENELGEFASDATGFLRVSPGLVAGMSVVRPTAHPQVALFSAPPCPANSAMRVRFWKNGAPYSRVTRLKPCRPGKGVNHYVAGMHKNAVHFLRGEIVTTSGVIPGSIIPFVTGSIPALIEDAVVEVPPDGATSVQDGFLLSSFILRRSDDVFAHATDLSGEIVWTYGERATDIERATIGRPVTGGTVLFLVTENGGELRQVVREIDLLGNIVRETNVAEVNRRLQAIGQDPITTFHHEANRLPDGSTVVLGYIERVLTDVQGPGDVNVLADMILVLDRNFQLAWAWNAFDHLDPTELAILGESCSGSGGGGGCPPIFNAETANDWLHSNSVTYSPADNHLVVSVRHLDAVLKIDYADGAGSGNVVWRLGRTGDFFWDTDPGDIWPWQSHQHDAHYDGPYFLIYDNGNTRQSELGAAEISRGQVLLLDEINMVANVVHNTDLGHYSPAVGSAERLRNGGFHFHSGFLGSPTAPTSLASEWTAAGQSNWALSIDKGIYRSFRMKSLDEP